jgi:hypothetical protein
MHFVCFKCLKYKGNSGGADDVDNCLKSLPYSEIVTAGIFKRYGTHGILLAEISEGEIFELFFLTIAFFGGRI